MTAQTELHSASFREAPFIAKSITTVGGRKLVSHDFANSDFKNIEDLGLSLKVFSIEAIIPAPLSDSDETHQAAKEKLMQALDEEGSGTLWHAFFGKFTVKSGLYTITDSMTSLGETDFSLSFEIETDQALTAPFIDTKLDIKEKQETLSERLGLDTSKEYFNSGIASINAASDFVSDVGDKISSISDLYSQAFNAVSELTSSIQGIKNDAINLINLPGRMASDMSGLFDRIENIFTIKKSSSAPASSPLSKSQLDILGNSKEIRADVLNTKEKEQLLLSQEIKGDLDKNNSDFSKEKLSSFSELFDFNKDSIAVSEILAASGIDLINNQIGITAAASIDVGNAITEEQAEIITNEKVLSRQIRVDALGRAYVAASEVDYKSLTEIESTQILLDKQYQSIISDLNIPSETIKSIQILRDSVERFFFAEKLTVNQVIEIEISETPAQVLSFDLYGDTEKTTEILKLNDSYEAGEISGLVKVLTA